MRVRRDRTRFPLVLKLFLMTALLVITVIGLAIGVTLSRANKIATQTVNKAISSAATLFKDFEKTRLQELSLGASSLGSDSFFVAYIEKAQEPLQPADTAAAGAEPSATAAPPAIDPATVQPPAEPAQPTTTTVDSQGAAAAGESDAGSDVTSILDQLAERKELWRSDLLIATDADGIVLARTDQPNVAPGQREDLYETQPLVKATVDSTTNEPKAGVVVIGNKLYHAAVAPLSVGAGGVRSGYVLNAYEINDAFANQIAKTTQAEVVFVPSSDRQGVAIARSSDAPSPNVVSSRPEAKQVATSGKMLPPKQLQIGDSGRFLISGEPLTAQGKPVGSAIFLRSLDRELAPFKEIQNTLLAAGGIALLLAFILSWLISKRLTAPIEELAGFAQRVTEGDYSVQPRIKRADEVGILARAFAQMVSALRDKAELEELYAQMTARMEERGPESKVMPATSEEGTIMVTDLRGIAVGGRTPEKVLDIVSTAMRLQETEVRRQEGEVREIVGHRLVCTFKGDRAIIHAIRAARAITEELAINGALESPLSVGIGIASGDFVSGTVGLDDDKSGLALVGNAPLLALLFAWEAPTGHAFVSLETAQAASTDLLQSATREEIRLRWLPTPVPVVSIPMQSLTTGVMRSVDSAPGATSQMATVRMDETASPVTPAGNNADLVSGSLFANRYVIEQVIGRGGMGVVYRANDTQLDETVAIKTLPGDAMQRSSEELDRFKREIRLARKITHRNVLRTFDYGEANGVYFISMEFVRGYTLAELLEENAELAPRLAMNLARQICRGLQVAHEEGVIHRDIKPQNVLVDQKGQVKLMDFGIARMAETTETMTSAGLIVGTPHYMSPEQVQGKPLDARSDIYSMGIMMYEMLCGARPFNSPSLMAVLTAHITEKPKPPIEIRPDIGTEINRIIMKCLEKDVSRRYADGGELLADLDRLQSLSMAA